MKFVRRISAQMIAVGLAILLAGLVGAIQVNASATLTSAKTTAEVKPRAASLVDVNHATVEKLKTLPGIQDALALKIVKNRPYANKTQLSTKGVLPAATYRKIRALIIAKQ